MLLQFRPAIELKETLLHEMIHAWMFLCKIRDSDDHGPKFKAKMNFINKASFADHQVCNWSWNLCMQQLQAVYRSGNLGCSDVKPDTRSNLKLYLPRPSGV